MLSFNRNRCRHDNGRGTCSSVGWSHSVDTRIVLLLRATRLFKEPAKHSGNAVCKFYFLHCHHIRTDNKKFIRRCAVQFKACFTNCAGVGAGNCSARRVCERTCFPSVVKPRRPLCCTESIHCSWETSLGSQGLSRIKFPILTPFGEVNFEGSFFFLRK